jgi:hypothetical protein
MKKLVIFLALIFVSVVSFSQKNVLHRTLYVFNDINLDTLAGGFLFSDTSEIIALPSNIRGINIMAMPSSVADTVLITFKVTNDIDSTSSWMPYGDSLIITGNTPVSMEKQFITYPFLMINAESISADTNSGYFDVTLRLTRQYKE